jgi:FKBP-type peptidyl-prolyl cis-trans isomerase FkpA
VTDRTSRQTPAARRLALVFLTAALAATALATTACSGTQSTPSSTTPQSTAPAAGAGDQAAQGAATTAPAETPGNTTPFDSVTKLVIKDDVVGTGPAVKAGQQATVDYTGWLTDGTKFDSSVGKQPFTFAVGGGQVIEGWDKGVEGMKVGGTRTLIIPSAMGYGPQGSPPVIPADATLKFQVKLLSVGQ